MRERGGGRVSVRVRVRLILRLPGARESNRIRRAPSYRPARQSCRTRVWTCSTQDGAARGLQRPRGQGDGRQDGVRRVLTIYIGTPPNRQARCWSPPGAANRARRGWPWARSIASSWRAFTPDETTGASSSLDSNVCYPKCTDPLTLRAHLPDCHSMQRHGKYASSSFRAAFFAPDLSHAGMDL